MAQEQISENPIHSIRLSVEGGWNHKPNQFQLDGSVSIADINYVGEVVSEPSKNLEEAQDWLFEKYPKWLNKTCAVHINLQITNEEQFKRLATKDFEKTFCQNAVMWGKENHINTGSSFWKRLEGGNSYCTKGLDTRTRYKQLDFTKGNNVIVCRLFPTFQKRKLSISAVAFFYNLVSNYIKFSSY